MTNAADDEKHLRQQYLKKLGFDAVPEPPEVDEIVEKSVRQANAQLGSRDLLTLAISSFFAMLLMFGAPLVAASVSRKKKSYSRAASLKDKQGPKV